MCTSNDTSMTSSKTKIYVLSSFFAFHLFASSALWLCYSAKVVRKYALFKQSFRLFRNFLILSFHQMCLAFFLNIFLSPHF